MGYLRARKAIGQTVGHINAQQVLRGRAPRLTSSPATQVSKSFDPSLSHYLEFKASEWPANSESIREAVVEFIELFIEFIDTGANHIGL